MEEEPEMVVRFSGKYRRSFERIQELSTYDHPKNPFKGRPPEEILLEISDSPIAYEYWQCVGSTRRPDREAKEN